MPVSSELAEAVRERLAQARLGDFEGPEMQSVRPVLETQATISAIPSRDELLIERVETREGDHLFFYPFEGRLVHEELAALFAWRLARMRPATFSMAVNDYGLELLAPDPAAIEEALENHLLSPRNLARRYPRKSERGGNGAPAVPGDCRASPDLRSAATPGRANPCGSFRHFPDSSSTLSCVTIAGTS